MSGLQILLDGHYINRNNQWSAKKKAPMKDSLTVIKKTYINHIGAIIYAKLL